MPEGGQGGLAGRSPPYRGGRCLLPEDLPPDGGYKEDAAFLLHGHHIGDRRTLHLFPLCGGLDGAILLHSIIVVSGVDSAEGVRIAERIRTLVSLDPFPLDHGPLKVTVSIGVATFHPEDYNGVDYAVDALLKRADAALYWAKEEGRNRVVLFEGGRDEGADSRG